MPVFVESYISQHYGSHFNIFYEILFSFTHRTIKNSFCISATCITILDQIVQVNKEWIEMSQHYLYELVAIFPLTILPPNHFAGVHCLLCMWKKFWFIHLHDVNVLCKCLWHHGGIGRPSIWPCLLTFLILSHWELNFSSHTFSCYSWRVYSSCSLVS